MISTKEKSKSWWVFQKRHWLLDPVTVSLGSIAGFWTTGNGYCMWFFLPSTFSLFPLLLKKSLFFFKEWTWQPVILILYLYSKLVKHPKQLSDLPLHHYFPCYGISHKTQHFHCVDIYIFLLPQYFSELSSQEIREGRASDFRRILWTLGHILTEGGPMRPPLPH